MNSFAIPKASSDPLPELAEFLKPFAPLFRRRQSRQSLERYITGLLTDLGRKNCQTIASAVAGTSTERLQHLLTDAEWDPLELDAARVRLLSKRSPKGGILILDDTSLPKKGNSSVGVAPQYSGTLGKIANCQILVSAEYVADEPSSNTPLHWPISGRLYLPEESWAKDSERRKRAHVPEEIGFATKPQLALDMVDLARQWEVPFELVVADSGYGKNPAFLEALERRRLPYVCGVERTFGVRLPEEVEAAGAAAPTGLPRQGPTPQGASGPSVHCGGRRWISFRGSMAGGQLAGRDQRDAQQADGCPTGSPSDRLSRALQPRPPTCEHGPRRLAHRGETATWRRRGLQILLQHAAG